MYCTHQCILLTTHSHLTLTYLNPPYHLDFDIQSDTFPDTLVTFPALTLAGLFPNIMGLKWSLKQNK